MPELSAAPRILIVRLSAIGDIVHGMPVACALRDALPGAFLAWAVEGRGADLLRGHRALDAVVDLPRGWLRSPARVLAIRARLRALRFDWAVDCQGLAKSAILARLSGARRRTGFAPPAARELSHWLYTEAIAPVAVHVVDRNLDLLRGAGLPVGPVRFDAPIDPEAEAWAGAWQAAEGLGRFAVCSPGAGWVSKLWPRDRFAAVARRLRKEAGVPLVVAWAGAQEKAWAEEIVGLAPDAARLAPPSNLPQLASLLRRASLCLASDTGPLHLAAALAVPCVGLFGPMPSERNGPYGAGHIALQKVRFEGTSRERRNAPASVMEAIGPDEAAEACLSLLGGGA